MQELIQLRPLTRPGRTFPSYDVTDGMTRTIQIYFGAVTRQVIVYQGEAIKPFPLVVSPLIFRELHCPEMCGACCRRGSLDYLPTELNRCAEAKERIIVVNGKPFTLYSDLQTDHSGFFCRNLLMHNGRCGIYENRPWDCDLAPVAVTHHKAYNMLSGRKQGRAWQLIRVDGIRGALSEMLPATEESIAATRRRLSGLMRWVNYFELETWMPEILDWANQNPVPTTPLRLGF